MGPDGSPLTVADLPPPGTKRWVIRRKAEVVAAVGGGLLSLEEACSRYMLTVDEFLVWQRSIDRHGLAGLRSMRTQQYRQNEASTGWRDKTSGLRNASGMLLGNQDRCYRPFGRGDASIGRGDIDRRS